MTPTLYGRWQTRIFLLCTIGLLVTWIFASGWAGTPAGSIYYWVLLYVGIIGLAWDVLYNFLQQYLWDHDWPGLLQFFAGIAEGILIAILFQVDILPHLDRAAFHFRPFVLHYGAVWLAVYLTSWMVMRLLFPRWRFRGGEWMGKWRRA
ncbi:hypothetical protein [Leptolyngbya sp. FACHB-711]|uniref:hypothetical protein n=1 Tax=unclassified Leptolyngbya TaxID=2650499 RepID=UPI001685C9F4|nr:hypothetical protein [Leptolyngbya sp. FACHB-711]MBD1851994.1 hypothetical protein [Cyanobacteria bacterium FACHB-502]MBD2026280.1 hypothetical protein [Leptolyngbya sp. FACHB-711]